METALKGKTVLITGASRNMGKLAAIAFARERANLAICTSAKMKELNEVAAECRALGAQVVAEQCDVADAASVNAFVAKVAGELGNGARRLEQRRLPRRYRSRFSRCPTRTGKEVSA
jgi:3-oxoacyl-[acyl-carrier protein] reductase